jgi:hypothetical protein
MLFPVAETIHEKRNQGQNGAHTNGGPKVFVIASLYITSVLGTSFLKTLAFDRMICLLRMINGKIVPTKEAIESLARGAE